MQWFSHSLRCVHNKNETWNSYDSKQMSLTQDLKCLLQQCSVLERLFITNVTCTVNSVANATDYTAELGHLLWNHLPQVKKLLGWWHKIGLFIIRLPTARDSLPLLPVHRARHFMQLHILQRKSPFLPSNLPFLHFLPSYQSSVQNVKNGLVIGVNLP